MMRIRNMTLYELDIPFVEQFAHATKTRKASDALLVKIDTHDGVTGWGETLVRPYLSGESVGSTVRAFLEAANDVKGREWRLDDDFASVASNLDDVISRLPRSPSQRAHTGLRCALELAIIDALLRGEGKELSDFLPPRRKEVIYSGIVSAEQPEKSLKLVRQLKLLGIQHYKLKVTPQTAVDLVRDARSLIGSEASLRLDANTSFTLGEARQFCVAIQEYNVAAIEEPLLEATPVKLAELQALTPIPVMVDEALVTMADGERLIELQSSRMFNVRLAKCGGIVPCLKLIQKASAAGIRTQLGALVGETAILSTVGRALAAHCDSLQFVEGSFGTLLLKEDIGRRSIRFGHGGRGPLLKGPGLGVDVDEEIVNKYCLARHPT